MLAWHHSAPSQEATQEAHRHAGQGAATAPRGQEVRLPGHCLTVLPQRRKLGSQRLKGGEGGGGGGGGGEDGRRVQGPGRHRGSAALYGL